MVQKLGAVIAHVCKRLIAEMISASRRHSGRSTAQSQTFKAAAKELQKVDFVILASEGQG